MSKVSKNNWFWRYGYIAVIPVVLLVVWVMGSDERENQNNVNPEVFVAFKDIEADCRAESFATQSNPCTQIFVYQKDCKLVSAKCNSLSFYQLLTRLKFELPPYYQDGFIEK